VSLTTHIMAATGRCFWTPKSSSQQFRRCWIPTTLTSWWTLEEVWRRILLTNCSASRRICCVAVQHGTRSLQESTFWVPHPAFNWSVTSPGSSFRRSSNRRRSITITTPDCVAAISCRARGVFRSAKRSRRANLPRKTNCDCVHPGAKLHLRLMIRAARQLL
jgi:hypothetical protein